MKKVSTLVLISLILLQANAFDFFNIDLSTLERTGFNISDLEKYKGIIPDFNITVQNFTDYYNEVGKELNFDPSTIIDCLSNNNTNSSGYFILEAAIYKLDDFTLKGNTFPAYYVLYELMMINAFYQNFLKCYQYSPGFQAQLASVGFNSPNSTQNLLAFYTYIQGQPRNYALNYKPIFKLLLFKKYKEAGAQYGKLFREIGANSTGAFYRNTINALNSIGYLGFFLPAPIHLWDCYNETSAKTNVQLITGLFQAVTQTNSQNAPQETDDYLKNQGGKYLKELSEVYECRSKTTEQKTFNNKIGMDILSEQFIEVVQKYYHEEPISYYKNITQTDKLYNMGVLVLSGLKLAYYASDAIDSSKNQQELFKFLE